MRARILAYDVGLAIWALVWIGMGFFVYENVRGLAELSVPVIKASRALDETAEGLDRISSIPLIGDAANLDAIKARVREVGMEARASARESRENVRTLAWLLGISIALVPTLPLLAIYVPVRRDWRRRTRE
ncbi:MAG: hypothetical protein ABI717_02340 [Actinomycetota bacterium]